MTTPPQGKPDAFELELTPDDLDRIERAVPAGGAGGAGGDRYPAPQMAQLDSERESGVAA